MVKNQMSASKESKEKDLEQFEDRLQILAKSGEISFAINESEIANLAHECEATPLHRDIYNRYLSAVKRAFEDSSIEKARRRLFEGDRPLGRHVQFLRKEAEISVGRIAERLGTDAIFIEKFESGELSPVKISHGLISDIMALFNIKLKELISCTKVSLEISSTGGVASAHARADRKMKGKERFEDISAAIEDLVYASRKKEPQKITVPEDFLSGVTKELVSKGRTDLVK